ncbi:cyclic nucleotide-binding and patatin-like phospholipase domain-containing protein [Mongoliibacter ruber]|uniref:NTE family protein n=1 Tax=Mongoliibacter ruber TaxID=1750599 RepID=A0A2T0WH21_9BACT|nr:cyclic nucleotide-binding and patatin-like phospholipase domain-containing protein [Mongoliibacter ruber]PRY85986.1 NTE family protein [Mongoliibacter ruber]
MENPPNFDPHVQELLSNLFGEVEEAILREIFESGVVRQIDTGDYLFKQGEGQNELFIVLSGRLRAIQEAEGKSVILGDIAEGEPVGEIALFTNEPRMASVMAVRKSSVLEINQNHYRNIVSKSPDFAAALTRFVINRLRRNVLQQHVEAAPKNIALIHLQPQDDLTDFLFDLKDQLQKDFLATKLHKQGDVPTERLFESLESHKGTNLMYCSGQDQEWTKHCLLYADLVLVVSDFDTDREIHEVEAAHGLYQGHILNKKTFLLLLHPEGSTKPSGTQAWLRERPVNLHLHIRRNHKKDLRRLSRMLTNKAVGLVLGGGGTKGYAHVGAVKALLNAGLEVDFVGGTSAGAIYGLAMTYSDFDFDKIDQICKQSAVQEDGVNDFFLNIFSNKAKTGTEDFIQKLFGEQDLEDLWINSYCVSTNISNSEVRVHNKGKIREQVQASFALPGVFPPVVIDDQVYVDGGVSDNLPVDPMYRYPIKHIIAISLNGSEPEDVDSENFAKKWEKLKDSFGKNKKYDSPVLTSVLVNSMTLNSRQKEEITKSKVSLYFEMNLRAVSLLDDSKWEKVVKKGYEQTRDFLAELSVEEKFWKS